MMLSQYMADISQGVEKWTKNVYANVYTNSIKRQSYMNREVEYPTAWPRGCSGILLETHWMLISFLSLLKLNALGKILIIIFIDTLWGSRVLLHKVTARFANSVPEYFLLYSTGTPQPPLYGRASNSEDKLSEY